MLLEKYLDKYFNIRVVFIQAGVAWAAVLKLSN